MARSISSCIRSISRNGSHSFLCNDESSLLIVLLGLVMEAGVLLACEVFTPQTPMPKPTARPTIAVMDVAFLFLMLFAFLAFDGQRAVDKRAVQVFLTHARQIRRDPEFLIGLFHVDLRHEAAHLAIEHFYRAIEPAPISQEIAEDAIDIAPQHIERIGNFLRTRGQSAVSIPRN